MNLKSKFIFIVGPGGSGKSTVGKVLAEKINYQFVDVDLVFCEQIGLIGDYIRDNGYKKYCEANSKLFDRLLELTSKGAVFALPSGFLVHEDSPELVAKHLDLLKDNGISILLLASGSLSESLKIVIPRQMSRGYLDTSRENEIERHKKRFPRYKDLGDVQIFSHKSPSFIAGLMITKLQKIGFQF